MDTETPPPPSQLQELNATAAASQDENEEELPTTNLPLASLSLSFFSPFPKPPPSQVSSLSLSLFPPQAKSSSKLSAPSNVSNSLLLFSSPFLRRPFRGRRCTIVWFHVDLRLHNNEPLFVANAESLSLLPIFLFEPCDFGCSPSGFDRTSPYRARFLIDSVGELRQGLHRHGSDLVVRIGRPEVVLLELTRAAGIDAMYAHREVSHDETCAEERVAPAMEAKGVAGRRQKWRRRKSRKKKGVSVRFIK